MGAVLKSSAVENSENRHLSQRAQALRFKI